VVTDEPVVHEVIGERRSSIVHRGTWRGRSVWLQVARRVADAELAQRFALEVEARARVAHPGLMPTLHSGRLRGGAPYLVMGRPDEDGAENLAGRLERAELSLFEALTMVESVGGALTALHDAGLRHGDIRPESVMLCDGRAVLLELPSPGQAPEHVAPERLFGDPATVASDVYELAALLWNSLTRSPPWHSSAGAAARRGIPQLTVPESRAGTALDRVIRQSLSAVPERRPPTVRAFVDLVRAAAVGDALPDEIAPTVAEVRHVPPPPVEGHLLGETYRLVRLIGRGACGAVYEAEHLRLPRRFAVKVLAPDLDAGAQARFRREAEIIAALDHPHIVKVFDYDLDESGVPFMVMELLEGETLRERLTRGPLSLDEVVAVVAQVADAADAAHAHGVIHRDLKPENLFLRRTAAGDLNVQVLDFGISKVLSQNVTLIGTMLGTPGYAAPEQIHGELGQMGPATDVFGLGAIIYESLSGRRPFDGKSRASASVIFYRTCHEQPVPLRSLVRVAPSVEAVVLRALAKQPEQRPSSAGQLASLLAAAARRSARKLRLAVAAIAGSVTVASAALAVATQSRTHPGPPGRVEFVSTAAPLVQDRSPTTVRLLIAPPGAHVTLDGARVESERIQLPPGEHRLVVSAPGYVTLERTVTAARVGPELHVRLSRQPARKRAPGGPSGDGK